ncbi:MAG: ThuA domain-containing protein [Fibrobacteria bacterium]
MLKLLFTVGLVLSMAAKPQAQDRKLKILHYTYTPSGESSHEEPKAAGIKAMDEAAKEMNWEIYHTKSPAYFTDANLAPYDVIFFNNMCCTNGIFPEASQRAAAEAAFKAGKGYVATHAVGSATHQVTNWSFLGVINGNANKYNSHIGDKQPGVVQVDDKDHYINQGMPATIQEGTNEWFGFPATFPDSLKVHLLLSVKKGTPGVGTQVPEAYLPVSWCHYYRGSRAFYTSMGHFGDLFTNPVFRGHIFRALEWAGGRAPLTGTCGEPISGVGIGSQSSGKWVFAERFFSFRAAPLEISGATLAPGSFRIELFDSRGAKVTQEAIQGAKSFSIKVRKPGAYFMRAFAGTAWFTRRIVIL